MQKIINTNSNKQNSMYLIQEYCPILPDTRVLPTYKLWAIIRKLYIFYVLNGAIGVTLIYYVYLFCLLIFSSVIAFWTIENASPTFRG